MSDVKPTRSELIAIEHKIKLAQSGHALLKRKRDGLINEFFAAYEHAKKSQAKLAGIYLNAYRKIVVAEAVDGTVKLRAAAGSVAEMPDIKVKSKNVMGVVVPEISAPELRRDLGKRMYGIASTSPRIDSAADAYEEVLGNVIITAEIETTLRRLLLEIEKTKRRVNALEYVIIPNLHADMKFITLRLEEMERENIFRLKRTKNKAMS